ncbi:MAG: hypothetical protein M1834_008777 [Cirrosporium novae-zelandiae]|nr:MAG: hypothetical protein M1834_008777 [Cirrosporium novae-zelandiae]
MVPFGPHTTSDEAASALSTSIRDKTSKYPILITGVSPKSLGADTARALIAHKPRQLILASQDEHKIADVIRSFVIPLGTIVLPLHLDLSSLESVRTAAFKVSKWVTCIDALILTAGVMAIPTFQTSADGVEMQFAVNHLGHFLFTNLLIDKLLLSQDGAAVATYTSEAHQRANLNLDDINYRDGNNYNKWLAYANSKAANVLFSVGLAQHFGDRGLRSFAVDPGIIVTTSLARSVSQEEFKTLGWVDDHGNISSSIKTKTTSEGASSGIIAAFNHSLKNDKGYVVVDGILSDKAAASVILDRSVAQKLWQVSEQLVGDTFG